jgi:hypothetical protein
MTIHSIGKARESLNWSSENYKDAIREYLDTEGYSQISDSYIEGDLADMVFINPSLSVGEKTLVESKATTISVSDENLAREVLEYLADWLKLEQTEKFKFFIFAKSISKKSEFQRIYGSKCNRKSVDAFVNKFKDRIDQDSRNEINTADPRDVLKFFRKIEIWEGSGEMLKLAAVDKRKRSKLSLEGYAQSLITEVARRSSPIQEKTTLISNLVELTPPNVYYGLTVKYTDPKEIYGHYDAKSGPIPPFLVGRDGAIYTFHDLISDNKFEEIAIGKPFEVELDSEDNQQFLAWLTNQYLRRLFWLKGARRAPKSNLFFFEPVRNINGIFEKRLCKTQRGRDKEVTIPYYMKDDPKVLNFIFHHAVEASAKRYWGKWFVELIPRKEYSSDGVTLFVGDNKSAIDNKFRNPIYNRSSNRLSSVRFWRYYLLESQVSGLEQESWIQRFQFGKLWEMNFGWKPATIPLNQALLEEYDQEEDDE